MSGDVVALLEKAGESVPAARLLADRGYHDFAASRAYYALFYVAEAFLTSLGQAYGSHGGVVSAFGREFAKTAKPDSKFHRWLIDGQDIRNVGDYGLGTGISREQALELIDQAAEFIQAGRTHLQSS